MKNSLGISDLSLGYIKVLKGKDTNNKLFGKRIVILQEHDEGDSIRPHRKKEFRKSGRKSMELTENSI